MTRTPKIIPSLRYEDPKTAMEWLCQAFGFELHFVHERPETGVLHAELRMGDDLVMIGPAEDGDANGIKSPLSLPGQSQSLFVAIEDVDGHFETARRAEAVIIKPPHDDKSGARCYTCMDLEGHTWTFANYCGEPFAERVNA